MDRTPNAQMGVACIFLANPLVTQDDDSLRTYRLGCTTRESVMHRSNLRRVATDRYLESRRLDRPPCVSRRTQIGLCAEWLADRVHDDELVVS